MSKSRIGGTDTQQNKLLHLTETILRLTADELEELLTLADELLERRPPPEESQYLHPRDS